MEQQHPTIHTLKIETEFFKAVKERRKTFEIRKFYLFGRPNKKKEGIKND